MKREYVCLPYEYSEEMDELTDEEFGQLVRALLRYGRDGEAIPKSGNLRFFAARVMAREDRFQEAFEAAETQKREAGRKGAKKRWGEIAEETLARIAENGGTMAANSGAMADDSGAMADDSGAMADDSGAISANGENGYTYANTNANIYAKGSFLEQEKNQKNLSACAREARGNGNGFPQSSPQATSGDLGFVPVGCGRTRDPPDAPIRFRDGSGKEWEVKR